MRKYSKRLRIVAVLLTLSVLAGILSLPSRRADAAGQNQGGSEVSLRALPYHRHPPKAPLPATVDPGRFKENRAAYVAYTVAARTKPVLYQEPCFCRCSKFRGHKSLLDCYTDDHASFCPICRLQAVFTFEQYQRGKSPKQIREAMLAGEVTTIDMDKYVRDFQAPSAGGTAVSRKQD